MALVELGRFFDSIEAAIVRAKLQSEGLDSFIFDHEHQWDTFGTIRGVRLMVAEEDERAARAVLAEVETDSAAGPRTLR